MIFAQRACLKLASIEARDQLRSLLLQSPHVLGLQLRDWNHSNDSLLPYVLSTLFIQLFAAPGGSLFLLRRR